MVKIPKPPKNKVKIAVIIATIGTLLSELVLMESSALMELLNKPELAQMLLGGGLAMIALFILFRVVNRTITTDTKTIETNLEFIKIIKELSENNTKTSYQSLKILEEHRDVLRNLSETLEILNNKETTSYNILRQMSETIETKVDFIVDYIKAKKDKVD